MKDINVQLFYPYALITKGEIVYRGIKAGMNSNWTYVKGV